MANVDQTQQLYITYYGRPADPAGLAFWTTGANAALSADKIADLFAASPEYAATTAGKTVSQIINSFYLNIFGRIADPGGLQFWTSEVNKGIVSLQEVGLAIGKLALLQPPGSPDRVALESKIKASNLFTQTVALDTTASLEYAGPLAATYGVDYLVPVKTEATIPTLAATQAVVAGLPPVGTLGLIKSTASQVSEGQGVTFTITTIPSLVGQQLSYKLEGIQSADVVGGVLAGTVLVTETGVAVINVSIASDAVVESGEVLRISFPDSIIFPKPPGSNSVVINDTTVLPASFVLTPQQDIVSGTGVPLYGFIGNEDTLGQGDKLSRGAAEEAFLEVSTSGKFELKNFSTSGVQTLVINGDGTATMNDSSVAMSNTDISSIEVIRALQSSVLFSDIQVSDLDVVLQDSNGLYEFNYDASKLLSSSNVANVELDEIPVDQENPNGAGLKFSQGPSRSFASLERLNITSTNTSGDPLTNTTNVLSGISVGPALGTLAFLHSPTGDTSVEIVADLGTPNGLIKLIDAIPFDADLTLNYTSAVAGAGPLGRVAVNGAIGDNTLGLYSGSRPDSVGATAFDVVLQDGDDSVVTDLGSDSIIAAGGNDTIVSTKVGVGVGASTVTRDRDTVDAGDGNNWVITGAGNDSVIAAAGNDTINTAGLVTSAVNPDADIVDAGEGNNSVVTGTGSDSVITGAGNDFISAGVYTSDELGVDADNDTVYAGDGNNTVLTGLGNDSVLALDGNDSINVEDCDTFGNNTVDAGNGNNTVVAGFGNDSLITGSGDDTIVASNGNNTVRSGAGADVIAIGNGNDGVFAGEGNDTVVLEGKNLDDRDFIDGGADKADFISFTEGDRIERSETAGVRNIEGFELLNFGGVVDKRVDLLNGYDDDSVVNIVEELDALYNGSDGLLDDGPVRDVTISSLGLAGFGSLIGDIQSLKILIDSFVTRLAPVPLDQWTEADLTILSGFLREVDSILLRVPASVASPGVNATLQVVRDNLVDLVDTLGNEQFNKIYLDECSAEFLYSKREDYVISLDQALVASSNDVRNGTPFGLPFQDVRFFTVDAELAISSVTVDATTVEQTDGGLTRQGLVFLGQNALVQGGYEELIKISDTLTSASLVLDYDSLTGPSFNDRDVLQLVNAATFTANDLSNIQDLDRVELSSASSLLAQVFDLTITQAFLANQGGNLDGQFVISADPSLPPLSELVLRVAEVNPTAKSSSERILVLKSANLNVRLFDTGTNSFVPLANAGQYDVEVRDALFFTENNDDLEGTSGDDLFFAFEGGDLNPGDYADGGLGYDILELEFGVFNQDPDDEISFTVRTATTPCPEINFLGPVVSLYGLTLSEQFNLADIQGIEEFVFDPKNNDGVRFNGFNRGGNQFGEINLFDLDVLKTTPAPGLSTGADLLYLDDYSGRPDSNPEYGFADLAVFTFDGDDTVVAGIDSIMAIMDPFNGESSTLKDGAIDGSNWIDTGSDDDLIISIDHSEGAGDTILAGSGDDTVITAIGEDTTQIKAAIFLTGYGNGSIDAGEGNNLVITGVGNDTILSGAGNDTIKSFGGNNSIVAGAGNNFIETGAGNDIITTLGGDDSIEAGAGNNLVSAGDGNNYVCADIGNDTIITGTGSDTIEAGDGNNSVLSGAGNDSVIVGIGNDTVDAGEGNDTVINASGDDSIVTGIGNDFILFTAVDALGTADTVIAGSGVDTLQFTVTTDTDLAPRQGSPLLPGSLPLGPGDINPVLSGVDQLVVGISLENTLRLADTVARQSDGGNGIKLVANASGEDVIVTAGLIQANANDGGFKVGQSLDATLNGFFSSSDALGVINSGPTTILGAQASTSTAINNDSVLHRALANGFLFSDNGSNANVGAGVVGGSGNDKLTAGTKPVLSLADPLSVEKTRGFVSYQGNGGADTITLMADPAVPNPAATDAYSEFVRYDTAQDGAPSGQSGQLLSGFDQVLNFDNGGITLKGTTSGLFSTRFSGSAVDFNNVVTVAAGVSSPISVTHGFLGLGDGGVSIDDITGDKIVIDGSLLTGITGSNSNFLLDRFVVDRGFSFDTAGDGGQEAVFLSNAQGFSDSDITNLSVIAQKANSLAGGIYAENNQGGLIVAQGVSYSAVYYWNNDGGISGAGATVEEGELRLLTKVDTNTLAADDFLFQGVNAPV